ncbi:ATP-binding protein [Bacillus anthracis]|nr:ATP-binding protein [Bacillus anthracis]
MNNAELIFETLKKDGYTEILRMIKEQQVETDNLDFKRKSNSPDDKITTDDKKNYVKALSGFANTSGGVIVWGGNASKKNGLDAANEEFPIKNVKIFQTILNSLLSSALTPLLPNIQNEVIFKTGSNTDGFVVTYVPESSLPPHQALLGENRYYMRTGDNFSLMPHVYISDAFGRRQRPVLDVHYEIQSHSVTGSGPESIHELSIVVGIRNIGRYVAIYPAIKIKAEKNLRLLDRRHTPGLKFIPQTRNDINKNGYMFAGGIDDTVHPGTYRTVYPLDLIVTVKEKHLSGANTELDDCNFSFSYELFAQGCESVKGEKVIPFDELRKALLS